MLPWDLQPNTWMTTHTTITMNTICTYFFDLWDWRAHWQNSENWRSSLCSVKLLICNTDPSTKTKFNLHLKSDNFSNPNSYDKTKQQSYRINANYHTLVCHKADARATPLNCVESYAQSWLHPRYEHANEAPLECHVRLRLILFYTHCLDLG